MVANQSPEVLVVSYLPVRANFHLFCVKVDGQPVFLPEDAFHPPYRQRSESLHPSWPGYSESLDLESGEQGKSFRWADWSSIRQQNLERYKNRTCFWDFSLTSQGNIFLIFLCPLEKM